MLGALAVAITDRLGESAAAGGYVPAEHAAVIIIGTVDGLSQEDLQRRLGLSQPGTTRLVDRLVGRGLVQRVPGRLKRINALHLTPAGQREAATALDSRRELIEPLIADLTETEQRVAADLVDRMLRTLVRSGQSPWQICRECDQHDCESAQRPCPVEEARQSPGGSGGTAPPR